MLTLMGVKKGPEAHAFAVKHANIWIERSEIQASDTSKEARTACLEERTFRKCVIEVEKDPMYGEGIANLKKLCLYNVPLYGLVCA
ncbi:hypothetical protein TNCV_2159571 [Trichonephila clavipes]|nr:hypothetical protein TNCV_2159571 [Trichonephila clavipes]